MAVHHALKLLDPQARVRNDVRKYTARGADNHAVFVQTVKSLDKCLKERSLTKEFFVRPKRQALSECETVGGAFFGFLIGSASNRARYARASRRSVSLIDERKDFL